jgi:hypothetical protein
MKYILTAICLLLIWQTSVAQIDPVKHVLVIGIDGMSPDGIRQAHTPVMDQLMHDGAYTDRARAVLPTSSSPNWASMIMGAGPERHGITSNDWEKDRHLLAPVTYTSESLFPTIFSVLKAQRPQATTAAIYDWQGFGRLFQKSAVDYDQNGKDEYQTTQLAIDHIQSAKPTFTFVHLDHVDHAGHAHQHGSEEYYHSVAIADSLIGAILQATREAGMDEDMLLILSADHGGKGYGHGGESLAEMEIPFFVYGKGVKQNFLITDPVFTYDNAATAAFALGLELPFVWSGKPVRSAFKDFKSTEPIRSILPAPVIHPQKEEVKMKDGIYRAEQFTVVIDLFVPDAKLHYTLDGSEPTANSPAYEGPFVLSKSKTVQARAFQAGRADGPIASVKFVVE